MKKLLKAILKCYIVFLPKNRLSVLGRFNLLAICGKVLLPQYRFKWPQMVWWSDEAFNAYLQRFNEQQGFNTDRRWNQLQLMRLVESVPGDTVECGCYRGASSFLFCQANKANARFQRMHHIFDSCEGLSEPVASVDGTYWKKHSLTSSEDEVNANLAEYTGWYTLYKGWIPEKFPAVADKRFAFVHIDVDIYEPTRDSIAFFYSRMEPGAILLCDDYGFMSCPGATRACDEFLADKPEKMIFLASGGGYFIKGLAVAPYNGQQ